MREKADAHPAISNRFPSGSFFVWDVGCRLIGSCRLKGAFRWARRSASGTERLICRPIEPHLRCVCVTDCMHYQTLLNASREGCSRGLFDAGTWCNFGCVVTGFARLFDRDECAINYA